MDKLILPSILSLLFVLLTCGNTYSQGDAKISTNYINRTKVFANNIQGDSAHTHLHVAAFGQPRVNNVKQPEWFRQGAGFYGTYGFGVEYSMRRTDSHWYGNLFLGSITAPGDKITGAQFMFMSGMTVGYETLLHGPERRNRGEVLRTDVEDTQYYLRIGPGVGVTSVSHRGRQFETHPTIFTHTTIGAFRRLSRKTSVFTEFGGRLGYIPTLSEMHFVGGPHLSIGFLISFKEVISPFGH